MLPESRHKSSGRMSAPFHDAANNASRIAQPKGRIQLRRGAGSTGNGARGVKTVGCMRWRAG